MKLRDTLYFYKCRLIVLLLPSQLRASAVVCARRAACGRPCVSECSRGTPPCLVAGCTAGITLEGRGVIITRALTMPANYKYVVRLVFYFIRYYYSLSTTHYTSHCRTRVLGYFKPYFALFASRCDTPLLKS